MKRVLLYTIIGLLLISVLFLVFYYIVKDSAFAKLLSFHLTSNRITKERDKRYDNIEIPKEIADANKTSQEIKDTTITQKDKEEGKVTVELAGHHPSDENISLIVENIKKLAELEKAGDKDTGDILSKYFGNQDSCIRRSWDGTIIEGDGGILYTNLKYESAFIKYYGFIVFTAAKKLSPDIVEKITSTDLNQETLKILCDILRLTEGKEEARKLLDDAMCRELNNDRKVRLFNALKLLY